MTEPIPGRYQHFKGGLYDVLGTARHTETDEALVVYKGVFDGRLWVWSLAMFIETVPRRNGTTVPRFRRVVGDE